MRFSCGRLYEIEIFDNWIAVVQFRQKVSHTYHFNILAKTGPISSIPYLTVLEKSLKDSACRVKEIQVNDLPLYMNLTVYPAMEKILAMGNPSQRQLRLACRRTLNKISHKT